MKKMFIFIFLLFSISARADDNAITIQEIEYRTQFKGDIGRVVFSQSKSAKWLLQQQIKLWPKEQIIKRSTLTKPPFNEIYVENVFYLGNYGLTDWQYFKIKLDTILEVAVIEKNLVEKGVVNKNNDIYLATMSFLLPDNLIEKLILGVSYKLIAIGISANLAPIILLILTLCLAGMVMSSIYFLSLKSINFLKDWRS